MSHPSRSHHDMGGVQPFVSQPIDRTDHDLSQFDKQVDAIVNLLGRASNRLMRTDELRDAIESLPPEVYDDLAYYEKWIQAVADVMVRKDIIGEEELVLKLAELKQQDEGA